ncbi:hypothetical protein ES705_14994 [subsurface metagenome]
MGNTKNKLEENAFRRSYGIHLTSSDISLNYIFPEIKEKLWKYRWIDLYAGEGNLILPVLNLIPSENRIKFFEEHIYLFDIHPEMVDKCIENAKNYGIPSEVASNNIKLRNNLESFPIFLINEHLPLYHITNPPYLYLGYIRKHKEIQEYLKLFEGKNKGYQDLYQIAMINDLRNNIENLIYIIPSNFLFGASVSNKFRLDLLKYYKINKMFIFEIKIFEYTGTNICIGFFKKKPTPKSEIIEFSGIKIRKKDNKIEKRYILKPEFNYRAGSEFDEFLEGYLTSKPLIVKYYLLKKDVLNNKGNNKLDVIDANDYRNNQYNKLKLQVNDKLKSLIESNILYVRTVDTPSDEWNYWRYAYDWPLDHVNDKWYFTSTGSLINSTLPSINKNFSYLYDPRDPVLNRGGQNQPFDLVGPMDQRSIENRTDVLIFETPVLTESVETVGRILGNLFVTSNCTDTDFTVKLTDVYPDGRSMLICDGSLTTRSRYNYTTDVFMSGNQVDVYELLVDCWSTAYVFAPGHRIRIAISSSNFPRFAANPNNGAPLAYSYLNYNIANNTLLVGPNYPSCLILPRLVNMSSTHTSY